MATELDLKGVELEPRLKELLERILARRERHRREFTSIQVRRETVETLRQLKQKLGARSYDDVIRYILATCKEQP